MNFGNLNHYFDKQIVHWKALFGCFFSWTVSICLFKSPFSENFESQIGHSCGFLFSWTLANLNKSVWLMTNTTTASKYVYIPKRTRIDINWNSPFQTQIYLVKVPLNVNIVKPQILAACLFFHFAELCKFSARLDNIDIRHFIRVPPLIFFDFLIYQKFKGGTLIKCLI